MKKHHIKNSHSLKPLYFALLSILSIPTAQAADSFTGLVGGQANAVSADGTVVVGRLANNAFSWTNGVFTNLPSLNSSLASYATAVSSDGSVVVGVNNLGFPTHAFLWSAAGGLQDLGGLDPNFTASTAAGVSANGAVVVGMSSNVANRNEAYAWTQATGMVGLGALDGGNFDSRATGVNANGSVIVGYSTDSANHAQAFRWTNNVMTGLGFLGAINNNFRSEANAVSADGAVVVGWSRNATGSIEAFRWVNGVMTGLGFFPQGNPLQSIANAVNSDGSVVVGFASTGTEVNSAFRWTQATGMITVQQWLANAGVSTNGFTQLVTANGVSANGNTIVGNGTNASNQSEAFIARVDGATAGIVGLTDLANSMTQTLAVSSQMESLTWLSMNGAHHRPLTDLAVGDSNSCAWVSGDAGRVYHSANGYTGLAEVGACHDFAEQGIRVGAGVGSSFSNLKLANSGNSRIQGQYGIAELDWQVPNKPLVASLLGIYGQWDANLKRGYAIAGTQPSTGDTNVTAYSLRARVDWQDAFHLGQVGVSPRVAYTITRSEVDGYQEQGGSAPANFKDQNSTAQEVRVGLTGKYALNDKVTLLGHTELAHRFDARGATIQGNINALGVGIGFNQAGNAVSP